MTGSLVAHHFHNHSQLLEAWRYVWVMLALVGVGIGLYTVVHFWRSRRPVRLLAMATIVFASGIVVAARLEAGLGSLPFTWKDVTSPILVLLSIATFIAVVRHEGRFDE